MSISIVPVFAELQTFIKAKWPEFTKGYTAMQASRINWRDETALQNLVTPFLNIRPMPLRYWEDAPFNMPAMVMPLELVYIASTKLSTEQAETYGTSIELVGDKCISFAIDVYTEQFDSFQLIDRPNVDFSDEMIVNSYILNTGAPFVAGMVMMELLLTPQTVIVEP